MSPELLMRGALSGFAALLFAWTLFSRQDDERDGISELNGQKYTPYIPGSLLPMILLGLAVLGVVYLGFAEAARMMLSTCFGIFLSICLYYPVLLLMLPLLRKRISARACAMLWLLPNYLYILTHSIMHIPSPLFVIPLKGSLVRVLPGLWFTGFTAVLLWKTIEHWSFRRQVLADARPVTDPRVLESWYSTLEDVGFQKPKFKLVSSPRVATPLSIGLYKRSIKVVLPQKTYSDEDLELILRHELVHIGREDAWNKFFMVFCTAICWFNPLMWVAMRKSAEDMELSCDETVLLNAGDDIRKQYARLLLDTASDERGFTTCLSATANALRYRLKSITKPGKRRSGALIAVVTFFLLSMTSGYVALAYHGDSGYRILYPSAEFSEYSIQYISMADDAFHTKFEITDEAAFHEYLASLSLYELTGGYTFSDSERCYTCLMDTPEGTESIVLYDQVIKAVSLHGETPTTEYFYVPGGLDWAYLDTILIPLPACNLRLYGPSSEYGRDVTTYLNFLWKTQNAQRALVWEGAYPEGEYHGIFGSEPDTAVFTFTHELAAPFSVLVESWDHSERYVVPQAELRDGFTMDLPDYPAHYTIFATFRDGHGVLYEAEFWFNIGPIDSVSP